MAKLKLSDLITEFCGRPGDACDFIKACIENGQLDINEYLCNAYQLRLVSEEMQDLFEDEYHLIFFSIDFLDTVMADKIVGKCMNDFANSVQSDKVRKMIDSSSGKLNTMMDKQSYNTQTEECNRCYMIAYRGNQLIDVYTTGKPILIKQYLDNCL